GLSDMDPRTRRVHRGSSTQCVAKLVVTVNEQRAASLTPSCPCNRLPLSQGISVSCQCLLLQFSSERVAQGRAARSTVRLRARLFPPWVSSLSGSGSFENKVV